MDYNCNEINDVEINKINISINELHENNILCNNVDMDTELTTNIYNRIDNLINIFVDEYPKSFSTGVINNMIDNLSPNSFIIKLSIKIWNLTPSNILDLNDIIDIGILIQLSYDTYLLFMDIPDICDYSNDSQFNLAQIQLSIIWLSAFLMQQVTNMIHGWQIKNISENDKHFLYGMGKYFQERIINQHCQITTFQKLSDQLSERRNQFSKLLAYHDTIFYQELIY